MTPSLTDSCEGQCGPRLAPSGMDIPPQHQVVSFSRRASRSNHVLLVGEQILKRADDNVCKDNSSEDRTRSVCAGNKPAPGDVTPGHATSLICDSGGILVSVDDTCVAPFVMCCTKKCTTMLLGVCFASYRFETGQNIKAKPVEGFEEDLILFDHYTSAAWGQL